MFPPSVTSIGCKMGMQAALLNPRDIDLQIVPSLNVFDIQHREVF